MKLGFVALYSTLLLCGSGFILPVQSAPSTYTTFTHQVAQVETLINQWKANPSGFKRFSVLTQQLLQLNLWMKDNFELAESPRLQVTVTQIFALLSHPSTPNHPEVKALKAAYYLLTGNRHLALSVTQSALQLHNQIDLQLIKILVGKPVQNPVSTAITGVWRMDLNAAKQLAQSNPHHAMAQALLVEAIFETVLQPDPKNTLLPMAQKSLQIALKLMPQSAYYRYQQGQLLYLQGRSQPAWQTFSDLIKDSQQNPIVIEAVGNFYLWMNDKPHTIELYRCVLALEPQNQRLYRKLELAYLQTPKSLEQVIAMYLNAIEKYPEQEELAKQFIRFQAESEYELVLLQVRLQQSLSRQPHNYRLHYLQGYWHGLAQQDEQAENAYLKALQANPKFRDAYQQLFGIYWEEQAFDKLKPLLKQAQAHVPQFAEAAYWQGLLALEENQSTEAIAHLQHALKLKPSWDAARHALAVSYRINKSFEQAHRLFNQMLQQDPENTEIIMQIGDTYFQEKKFAQAERHYLWASHIEPYAVGAYFSLGNLYSETDAYDKAIQAFERAILIAPWNPDNRNNLGNVYLRYRKMDLARNMFQRILAFAPDYATAYYNLACAYALESQPTKAMRFLKQAIELDQSLKKTAVEDTDLNSLHADPGFQALIH